MATHCRKCRQVDLLAWRLWRLFIRKPFITTLEFLIPIILILFVALLRFIPACRPYRITNVTTFDHFLVDNGPRETQENFTNFLYAPKTPLMDRVMSIVGKKMGWRAIGFQDEVSMIDAFYTSGDIDTIFGGVVFDNMNAVRTTELPKVVQYRIRPSSEKQDWHSGVVFPFRRAQEPRYKLHKRGFDPGYEQSGFLAFQYSIDSTLIEIISNLTVLLKDKLRVQMRRVPFPAYFSNHPLIMYIVQLPSLLMLGLVFTSIQITRNVVEERENKLLIVMKTMGMRPYIYWGIWFARYVLYAFIIAVVWCVLLCVPFHSNSPFLYNSSPSLVFLFLLSYTVSVVSFSLLASVFFNTKRSAAIGGCVIFILSHVPEMCVTTWYSAIPRAAKLTLSLLSNIAMTIGVRIIASHEDIGVGSNWTNWIKQDMEEDDMLLCDMVFIMILDSVLYLVLFWYLTHVIPGENGVAQHWYFPFTLSFWCGEFRIMKEDYLPAQKKFTAEEDVVGLKMSVVIRNIRKYYGRSERKWRDVTGVSLNIYESEITALVGDELSGKDTLVSMLAGLILPSFGTAIINGFDLRCDLTVIRLLLGFCPRYDAFFNYLNAEENLWYFCQFMGIWEENADEEVNEVMNAMGLNSIRNVLACSLTRFQKRKLAVAIAMYGDAKVVILDEPCCGLDPSERRVVWAYIQERRKERTIILSTSFMDEADVLCDRVAIMAGGKIKRFGTPLFLKHKYGDCYRLSLIKSPLCQIELVNNLIKSYLPSAVLCSNIDNDLMYLLSGGEARFEELFREIENKKAQLGVSSFGVTGTTMGDVFSRVVDDTGSNECYEETSFNTRNSTAVRGVDNEAFETTSVKKDFERCYGNKRFDYNDGLQKNVAVPLKWQQYKGMLIKKIIHTIRHLRVTLILQLIVPVSLSILALSTNRIAEYSVNDRPLKLNLVEYGSSFVPVSFGDAFTQSVSSAYVNLFNGTKTRAIIGQDVSNATDFVFGYFVKKGNVTDNEHYTQRYLIGAEFSPESLNKNNTFTAYFSGEAHHMHAISLSYLMSAILQTQTNYAHSTEVTNDPLIKSAARLYGDHFFMFFGFNIVTNIVIGMVIFVTSISIFHIYEINIKAKRYQVNSGSSIGDFWFANFLWDYVNYLVPSVLVISVFVAFQKEAYVHDYGVLVLLLIFILYGWSYIPFLYMLHFLFKKSTTGMLILSTVNIVLGVLPLVLVVVSTLASVDRHNIADILEWVFVPLTPHYSFAKSLYNMYINYYLNRACDKYKMQCTTYPNPCCKQTGNCGPNGCVYFEENSLSLSSPGIGRFLLSMSIQGLVYITVTFLIEYGYARKWFACFFCTKKDQSINTVSKIKSNREDIDVIKARNDATQKTRDGALVIDQASKTFGDILAVNSLSLVVSSGECFGLVGLNSSGKSTVMETISGNLRLTEGDVSVNGYSVQKILNNDQKLEKVLRVMKTKCEIGYCPQFDPHLDQLTGRELLYLYARMRGVRAVQIPHVINRLIATLLLKEQADVQTNKYSVASKRKLSIAVSLVGDPGFVFLDDPTEGLDPKARRRVCDVLSYIRSIGRTIVISTNSMEECDAICTRVGVMVDGSLCCLGSPQHLKTKFGVGYSLSVRVTCPVDGSLPDLSPLRSYIEVNFPTYKAVYSAQGTLNYLLTDPNVSAADVFGAMERGRSIYNIAYYWVSQTTLDQVFVKVTSSSSDDQGGYGNPGRSQKMRAGEKKQVSGGKPLKKKTSWRSSFNQMY